jgi:hypothetical protein
LIRRLSQLRSEIGKYLNINPFLMCALKDFHNIKDQKSLSEFMLIWHLGTGHSTSFGKMIDEKLLPNVFKTLRLDSTIRHKKPYNLPPFDDIDHVVNLGDKKYLLSLKASSWSIQYNMAMGLYSRFKLLGEANLYDHAGIVVGVFYGNKTLLTDKYEIIRGINVRRQDILQKLDYVVVKAGKEFWSWLNGGIEETQDWVLEGILTGTDTFSKENPDFSNIVGGAANRLTDELRRKYDLPTDGSLDWNQLMHAINDEPDSEDEPGFIQIVL